MGIRTDAPKGLSRVGCIEALHDAPVSGGVVPSQTRKRTACITACVDRSTRGMGKSMTDSGFRTTSKIQRESEMKYGFELLLLCALVGTLVGGVGCQPNESHLVFEVDTPSTSVAGSPVLAVNLREVDASCGQCQFGMPGNGCDLAIRLEDKLYYVDGSSIDGHGDAHANDGLCNCVRKAIVSGKVVDGRFVASDMMLMEPKNPSAVNEEN
ncbi:DUF6370 family protein [bacterium]|nr:DUF6370 family protein [bacterium]